MLEVDAEQFLMNRRFKAGSCTVFVFLAIAFGLGGENLVKMMSTMTYLLFPSTTAVTTVTYHRERLKLVEDFSRVNKNTMTTTWGNEVLEGNVKVPWPEYPRPTLVREHGSWLSLNGYWQYAVTTQDEPDGVDGLPLDDEWDGRILVPYPVESMLSGVQRPLPLSEMLVGTEEKDPQARRRRRLEDGGNQVGWGEGWGEGGRDGGGEGDGSGNGGGGGGGGGSDLVNGGEEFGGDVWGGVGQEEDEAATSVWERAGVTSSAVDPNGGGGVGGGGLGRQQQQQQQAAKSKRADGNELDKALKKQRSGSQGSSRGGAGGDGPRKNVGNGERGGKGGAGGSGGGKGGKGGIARPVPKEILDLKSSPPPARKGNDGGGRAGVGAAGNDAKKVTAASSPPPPRAPTDGSSEAVGNPPAVSSTDKKALQQQQPPPHKKQKVGGDSSGAFRTHNVVLWYRRRFNLPDGAEVSKNSAMGNHNNKNGGRQQGAGDSEGVGLGDDDGGMSSRSLRYFLNFEAVDYEAKVWVNGHEVGGHSGGYSPWRVEITRAVRGDVTVPSEKGTHEVVVRVSDSTDGAMPRGKQSKNPKNIWYTSCSGIWQTVWVEAVPTEHVKDLKFTSKHGPKRSRMLLVTPVFDKGQTFPSANKEQQQAFPPGYSFAVEVRAMGGGPPVGPIQDVPLQRLVPAQVLIPIAEPKLWTPTTPYLYDVRCWLRDHRGQNIDEVTSYAALREVGRVRDGSGHLRMTLNGQPLFHLGTLDQGWWPDGLLTPPSDSAQVHDIEFLKASGFNMIRKHVKVENRRYYYHCDRLGMLVWQDQVSVDQNGADRTILSPPWTRLKAAAVGGAGGDGGEGEGGEEEGGELAVVEEGVWSDEEHAQFMTELGEMVDTLENHPCIVVWVPFNEAWGQHRTVEVAQWLVLRDPTRLVNAASGGNFWPVGHIADNHNYPNPSFPGAGSSGGNNNINKGNGGGNNKGKRNGGRGVGGFSGGGGGGGNLERFKDYVKVVGEFGGHGLAVPGHLWKEQQGAELAGDLGQGGGNWGYGKLPKHASQLRDYYHGSMRELKLLKEKHGIAAGVYTQTTDVEGEVNGLLTYDRKVAKIDPADLHAWHEGLVEGGFEL